MFKFFTCIGVAVCCVIGFVGVGAGIFLLTTPRPSDIKDCLVTKMYQVRLCPGESGYVRLKDISMHARNAVIVSEDGDFYGHKGIDWFELRRSFETNWERGTFARGGSTITQQLAKNVYLSSEKSLLRKAREALIAIQLEEILNKDEILEKYLNVVEFGPELYGISKASRHYFGKAPAQLTAAEGAFLAFLLPNPKKYSISFRNKQLTRFARRQVHEIIHRMHRFRKISQLDHDDAIAQIDRLFGVSTEVGDDDSGAEIDPEAGIGIDGELDNGFNAIDPNSGPGSDNDTGAGVDADEAAASPPASKPSGHHHEEHAPLPTTEVEVPEDTE